MFNLSCTEDRNMSRVLMELEIWFYAQIHSQWVLVFPVSSLNTSLNSIWNVQRVLIIFFSKNDNRYQARLIC